MIRMLKEAVIDWWLRVAVLLFILAPYLAWSVAPAQPLRVLVVDKTVPREDYREHAGLFWILNHYKVIHPEAGRYRLERDYYGYHPASLAGAGALQVDGVDLIYVADTYGVYAGDLGGENIRGERTDLLYGGLQLDEWNALWNAKGPDTTLIMEFNAIASPTGERARRQVERDMGFAWTGWIGRHFEDLAGSEVPVWLVANWERQSGAVWAFSGPGLAFLDEHDRVVVLAEPGVARFVPTPAGLERYPGLRSMAYPYWFDILLPSPDVTVEAEYVLAVSSEAEAVLSEAGIPLSFPAILHNEGERAYYFAGDWADRAESAPVRMWGVRHVMSALAPAPADIFYWRVYVPVMKTILRGL